MREESVLKKVSWSALIISILTGALGAALIAYPEDAQRLLAVILAASALGLGVYHLIVYFVSQRKNSMLATDLFLGVILILLGAFMYIHRAELLNYITIIFGLVLFVDCILELQNAIFVKRLGYANWLLILLFGFITLVFAVLMVLRPDFIQNALILISGIFLVVAGVTGIITFIVLRVAMHKAKKALADTASAASAVDVDYEEAPEEDIRRDDRSGRRERSSRRRPESSGDRRPERADAVDADFTDVSGELTDTGVSTAAGGDEDVFDIDETRPINTGSTGSGTGSSYGLNTPENTTDSTDSSRRNTGR